MDRTINTITSFIKESFVKAGFADAVIGLSGGVDSATSCALAVKALGKEHVFPVLMPYGSLNERGKIDALEVVRAIEIPDTNVVVVDIAPAVDAFVSMDSTMDDMRKGNVMARMRMITLFDQAKKRKALVVGTENKTEHLLGYFTRFGDEASDIEPLRNLYKTQVYEVTRELGLPEAVLTKAPTAGLWEGQTDEDEFGFTYKDADKILELVFDQKKPWGELEKLGFSPSIVKQVQSRVSQNAFKHELPIIWE